MAYLRPKTKSIPGWQARVYTYPHVGGNTHPKWGPGVRLERWPTSRGRRQHGPAWVQRERWGGRWPAFLRRVENETGGEETARTVQDSGRLATLAQMAGKLGARAARLAVTRRRDRPRVRIQPNPRTASHRSRASRPRAESFACSYTSTIRRVPARNNHG